MPALGFALFTSASEEELDALFPFFAPRLSFLTLLALAGVAAGAWLPREGLTRDGAVWSALIQGPFASIKATVQALSILPSKAVFELEVHARFFIARGWRGAKVQKSRPRTHTTRIPLGRAAMRKANARMLQRQGPTERSKIASD